MSIRSLTRTASGTREDLAAFTHSDLQKYAKLVKDAHIPAQ